MRLWLARVIAAAACIVMVAGIALTFVATGFLALAILAAAVLAAATGYAVYLGVYASKG